MHMVAERVQEAVLRLLLENTESSVVRNMDSGRCHGEPGLTGLPAGVCLASFKPASIRPELKYFHFLPPH